MPRSLASADLAFRRLAAVTTAVSLTLGPATTGAQTLDWGPVDSLLARPGTMQDGGVRRWSMPRTDLRVVVDGVQLRPAFALGSWLSMLPHEGGVMAMGDLVVRDDELNPVLSALQEGGVEQTAIHHHVIRESPRILYVHVHGHGDPRTIARAVRLALARTATPPAVPSPAPPPALELDTMAVNTILGHRGRANGGVWQVTVPRVEVLRESGVELPASMGMGTVINFQPTGNGRAAITGDFVLVSNEVNRVLRALRRANIEVTSLHNHLLHDEPRLFFMHFWAHDDALMLARALRDALAETNSRPPRPE